MRDSFSKAKVRSALKALRADESGASVIEYTMFAALIGMALIASAAPIAEALRPMLTDAEVGVESIRTSP